MRDLGSRGGGQLLTEIASCAPRQRGDGRRGVGVSHSTAEAGELSPRDPVEGRGHRQVAPVEGKTANTPRLGPVSTSRHRIAELARQALGMAVAIAWLPGPAGTRRRVAKPSVEEPDAAEPARPDLWGARVSNDPGLPDRFVLANDVDTEAFAFTTRPRTHFKRAAGRKGIPKVPRFAGPSHWPAGYSRWHSVRENTNRLHVVPRHTTLKLCCTNSCSLNARPRHHRCRLIWTRPNAKDTEARILVTTGPRIHPKFAAVRKGISKCTPFPALSHWLASHARDHSFS